MARARARMAELDVDVLLLSVGPDLPYLTGYEAMPLERLTMLVLRRDGDAALVVPRLEAPRVTERPDLFEVVAWDETDDPVALVARRAGDAAVAAIGDRTWARFLVDLGASMPRTRFRKGSEVMGPLRAVKDDAEGHDHVNFAIVGSGPNAASPHHDATDRVIRANEVVLCDFGGTMRDGDVGYCSDITRCVWTGGVEPPPEFRDLYTVLHEAQQAAVDAATIGTPCEDVDGVARRIITDAGYGPQFFHRTGHGIGIEEHEDPYIVGGNCEPLTPGHAFSVEPGIYFAGKWGARVEDIVVASGAGPDALNTADHALVVVDA